MTSNRSEISGALGYRVRRRAAGRGPNPSGRGGADPDGRGRGARSRPRLLRLPEVRAPATDRRVQDPRGLQRGARVARERPGTGVVTQSSGNHGQALAFAARQFGLEAVVVMPASTPRVKVAGVERHGGRVVFAGETRSAEQLYRAEAIAREEGLVMIPPFDHPDVVAGQGTCGLEILEQCPDVKTILVPVSGGGLLAGISVAVAALRPRRGSSRSSRPAPPSSRRRSRPVRPRRWSGPEHGRRAADPLHRKPYIPDHSARRCARWSR